MFKKNYFYNIEWIDSEGQKRNTHGITKKIKKVKTSVDLVSVIIYVLVEIENEYEYETGLEFTIEKYKILAFNEV